MPLSDEKSDNLAAKSRLLELIDKLSDDQLLVLLKKAEELLLKADRKQLRKLYPIDINFTVQDHEAKGTIHDISYSGVFIKTSKSFSVGSEVSLSFSIHGIQDPIKIIGEVARISSMGIGVKFKNLTKQQENIIKSIVDSC
jgi:hypothetical protein